MALPRPLLVLLLLNLWPLGGRASPLGNPARAPDEPDEPGLQELLEQLQDAVSELQGTGLALEPRPPQDAGPQGAWGAADAPVRADNVLRDFRGLRSPKMMRDSGCFGRRLDRIGSHSGLGCNVLRRH